MRLLFSKTVFAIICVVHALRFTNSQSGFAFENNGTSTCDNYNSKNFNECWINGKCGLHKYLQRLKEKNFTLFQNQCEKRPFAFTKFSSLLYELVCNRTEFNSNCLNDLPNIVKKELNIDSSLTSPNHNKSLSNIYTMKEDDLSKPCVQVAMINEEESYGKFYEIKAQVPFCAPIWCGFNAAVINRNIVSVWTCMPPR